MAVQVGEIAAWIHGRVIGDPQRVVKAARALSDAGPEDVTFLDNERALKPAMRLQAAAILTRPGLLSANGGANKFSPDLTNITIIETADPLAAFVQVYQRLHGLPPAPRQGIDPRAVIHPTVRLGRDVEIGPGAFIGEGTVLGARCRIYPGVVIGRFCTLGDDVTLYPNVVIYDGCTLGHRVTVHANSVIGADGFGYRQQNGRHEKIPQLGGVVIEDDVEIGACTTIDRGTFQPTRIGAGTKIDNLVQIAHNCRIGRHNLLVGQVGLAGSVTTGDYVVLAGQVAVRDHCTIGDGVVAGARAGIIEDIPAGQRVLGEPAMPEREYKRLVLLFMKLPEMRQQLEQIRKHLGLA
ncbi:MAG: UDP-3-O-(3-hydroxymyristoyl)glucosamine N-acyltransferase [Gemmatales bacterium]|nr:UDP-3-O-(3-hydroxymyristoyl)glucosamine N-acyltransferase [Gemmatales bacterium]